MNKQDKINQLETKLVTLADELAKLKEQDGRWPDSWYELGEISGAAVTSSSILIGDSDFRVHVENKNVFPSEAEADASIALAQLLQLRDRGRDGWAPDWTDGSTKHCVLISQGKPDLWPRTRVQSPLSFEKKGHAMRFMQTHHDLIMKAAPLL